MANAHFDLIVIGSGIVGLAHALEGARRGLSVAVVEREYRCIGASIRNFGFITVTGQGAGDTWDRARRSRETWAEVASQARIPILQHGLWVLAHRREALAVLEEFRATEMGAACRLVSAKELAEKASGINADQVVGALWSPHELRVESREAIPLLTTWLEERHEVRFFRGECAMALREGEVTTTRRVLRAERIVLCPGTELTGLAAPYLEAEKGLCLTRLQMLRVRPLQAFTLDAPVMSDLGLIRYKGYSALPSATALRAVLEREEGASVREGIHLIAVQSADGTLVVGDSHHNADTPHPFASEQVDNLILRQLRRALQGDFEVTERWVGFYPTGVGADCLIKCPHPWLRVVVVSSGTGASTGFGIAQDTFARWS